MFGVHMVGWYVRYTWGKEQYACGMVWYVIRLILDFVYNIVRWCRWLLLLITVGRIRLLRELHFVVAWPGRRKDKPPPLHGGLQALLQNPHAAFNQSKEAPVTILFRAGLSPVYCRHHYQRDGNDRALSLANGLTNCKKVFSFISHIRVLEKEPDKTIISEKHQSQRMI